MARKVVLTCMVVALWASSAIGQGVEPETVTRAEFNELVGMVQELTSEVKSLKEDTATRLADLRRDIDAVTDLQFEDRVQIEQLAKKDKDGRSYLRLDASHEPTRNELRRAMASTAPEQGDLVIDNRQMRSTVLIAVNDTTYEVMGGTERIVPVPLGNVQVRLQGQETVYRHVGFPGYKAKATIYPTYSPPSTIRWISSPPLYSFAY